MYKYGGKYEEEKNFNILKNQKKLYFAENSTEFHNLPSEEKFYEDFFNDLRKQVDIFWSYIFPTSVGQDSPQPPYDIDFRIFFNKYFTEMYWSSPKVEESTQNTLKTFHYLDHLIRSYNKKRSFFLIFGTYKVKDITQSINEYRIFLEEKISELQQQKFELSFNKSIDISKIEELITTNITDPFVQNIHLNAFENLVPLIDTYNKIIKDYKEKSKILFGNNSNRKPYINSYNQEDRMNVLKRIIQKLLEKLNLTLNDATIYSAQDDQYNIQSIIELVNSSPDNEIIYLSHYVFPFIEEYNLLSSARKFLGNSSFHIRVPSQPQNTFELITTLNNQINIVLDKLFSSNLTHDFHVNSSLTSKLGEKYSTLLMNSIAGSSFENNKINRETYMYLKPFIMYYNELIDNILFEIFGDIYYENAFSVDSVEHAKLLKSHIKKLTKKLWEKLEDIGLKIQNNNSNKIKSTKQIINKITDENQKIKFKIALEYILPILDLYEKLLQNLRTTTSQSES
jgi:hypothetical protein